MTTLTDEERDSFIRIARHLFERYIAADEIRGELTTAQRYTICPSHFVFWMVQDSDMGGEVEDSEYVELLSRELPDVPEDHVTAFVALYDRSETLSYLLQFITWYWPMLTIPKRPFADFEIETAYTELLIVIRGDGPVEDRTLRIQSRQDPDMSLGPLLEQQVVYQWQRGMRGATNLLLIEGLEVLRKNIGSNYTATFETGKGTPNIHKHAPTPEIDQTPPPGAN